MQHSPGAARNVVGLLASHHCFIGTAGVFPSMVVTEWRPTLCDARARERALILGLLRRQFSLLNLESELACGQLPQVRLALAAAGAAGAGATAGLTR